jgi:predicted alpha/beta-fold hydrolase
VINYRGLAGAELYTPRLYSSNNVEDHLEAMTYVYEKYCKPYNRQVFAVGLSTGANKMAHLMAHVGKETFISAATVICTASDLKICIDELEKPHSWFYRQWVVDQLVALNLQHSDILNEHYKGLNIDFLPTVKSLKI